MPNPYANPKSADRDALESLADHPGYKLLLTRLQESLDTGETEMRDAIGLQEVGRFQGACHILAQMIHLRETMIDEIDQLLQTEENKSATVRAAEHFYGKPKNDYN